MYVAAGNTPFLLGKREQARADLSGGHWFAPVFVSSSIVGGIFGSVTKVVLPIINHNEILGMFVYKYGGQRKTFLGIFGKFYIAMFQIEHS